LKINQFISLKNYNSFQLNAQSHHFVELNKRSEFKKLLHQHGDKSIFPLGGGSNILLVEEEISVLVAYINTKGIQIINESERYVQVKIEAGETWNEVVQWAVERGYGGIENLTLIPGKIGAAPIQNIGAYGVELRDSLIACEFIDKSTGELKEVDNAFCQFEYRDSIFKNELKNKVIITAITLNLSKEGFHQYNTSYGAISNHLLENFSNEINLNTIYKTVRQIRISKLPDPRIIGNSGSFFKNPIVSNQQLLDIQNKFPDVVHYPVDGKKVKLAAGWMIEKLNGKKWTVGGAGVHPKQALVLINKNNATGMDVLELSKRIQSNVFEHFGLHLETEVNIIDHKYTCQL
tara:strand:- start:32224 stop:33267 length:1044 start_codon:yes stop_codon:yes gene_type:complete